MKLKPTLAASLFALMAAISLNASAAADNPADTNVDKSTATKAATQKKVKPHSHMEEKTGVPQQAPEVIADKPKADKDKTRHYHPRDGK